MNERSRDAETLNIAGSTVTGIDREPYSLAAQNGTIKPEMQVIAQIRIDEGSSFAAEQAEESGFVHEETLALTTRWRVGLKGDEVEFEQGEGDEDTV